MLPASFPGLDELATSPQALRSYPAPETRESVMELYLELDSIIARSDSWSSSLPEGGVDIYLVRHLIEIGGHETIPVNFLVGLPIHSVGGPDIG